VIAYDVYRNDAGSNPIATVDGSTLTYSDNSVSPGTQYTYHVTARDAEGNTSDPSNDAVITTPSLDTENPTDPSNLQASATTSTKVHLTWDGSTDNVNVVAYDIYRGGNLFDSVDGQTLSYDDTTVAPGTPYSYTVRARDAAGNTSNDSNTAFVTTPNAGVLFADDFESGNLGNWTTNNGLTVEQGYPAPSGGLDVARESSGGTGATYAYKSFANQTTVYAQFQFKVNSRSGAVDLMRFRNGSGGSKLSLFVHGTSGQLATRNSAGTTLRSATTIQNGVWYQVQIEGQIGTDTTRVWLNGVHIADLDATGSLGSTSFGQFLLGTTGTGTYDTVFDDVVVSQNPI
jgi:chitodextrinase